MTDLQYEWLQATLGERCPDRATADADYARLGSLKAVALKYLYAWRAELIANASSVTITGALSVSYSENIKALERLIDDTESGPDDPSQPEDPDVDDSLPTMGVATFMPDFGRGRAWAPDPNGYRG